MIRFRGEFILVPVHTIIISAQDSTFISMGPAQHMLANLKLTAQHSYYILGPRQIGQVHFESFFFLSNSNIPIYQYLFSFKRKKGYMPIFESYSIYEPHKQAYIR